MTLWEFGAAVDGYMLAKGVKPKGSDISDDRLSELGIEGF
ncbi:hypothetical protein SAMN05216176_12516 [Nitratireductor indicus]|nr:hypothetical protein SAMN05216176_12516 [Nitratireductor indicus]